MKQIRELELDDKVEVFLYTDARERIAGTTTIPKITVGVYDWATVKDIKPGTGDLLRYWHSKRDASWGRGFTCIKRMFGQKLVMSFLSH